MKTFKSYKLFYNKFLYRLQIRNDLATVFREKKFAITRTSLDKLQRLQDQNLDLEVERGLRRYRISEESFIDAKKLYNLFLGYDDFKLRVESSYLNIYSNNKNWLKLISNSINSNNAIAFYQPDKSWEKLLDSHTIVLEKDIGFEYKVTIGKNRNSTGFAKWAYSNPSQVRLGPVAYEELLKNGYVDGFYFYAKNDKTLHLCSLMLDNIRRVDKILVQSNLDK